MSDVVTRFAPSPTGHLHVGGARTALFCWAFAKRAGLAGSSGRFMLRVEDTDQARSSEDSARGILEDLAWLGIDWDDGPTLTFDGRSIGGDARNVGPFYQARRLEIYNRYLAWMIQSDRAYPAFDTAEELEAARKAAAARKETFRYRRAPDYDRAASLARMNAGEPHVVRFRFPDEQINVTDLVLGQIKFAPEHVDDFVLRKADGFPTYHFAVVIDDELMGVTHVLRGQEHLNNTPKHVALQRSLQRLDGPAAQAGPAFRTPAYAHLPLIFNMDASKMSKRDKDKAARAAVKAAGLTTLSAVRAKDPALADRLDSAGLATGAFDTWVDDTTRQLGPAGVAAIADRLNVVLPEIEVEDFRAAGYLPDVLCNFLALLGWNPGLKDEQGKDVEKFDNRFLAERFGIDRLGKKESRFDRKKLLSFNADAIKKLTDDQFLARLETWSRHSAPGLLDGFDTAQRAWLAAAIKGRCQTLRDAVAQVGLFRSDDSAVKLDPAAVDKHLKAGDGRALVAALREILAMAPDFEPAAIEAAVSGLAAARNIGVGAVAQPARVALVGAPVSPPLGLTMAIFGRSRTLERLDRALAAVAG